MKNLVTAIVLSSAFLLTYVVSVLAEGHPALILALFSISPVVVIALVVKVLKDGIPSAFTFEERFYDDVQLGPFAAEPEA
jgi:hypothetical protein